MFQGEVLEKITSGTISLAVGKPCARQAVNSTATRAAFTISSWRRKSDTKSTAFINFQIANTVVWHRDRDADKLSSLVFSVPQESMSSPWGGVDGITKQLDELEASRPGFVIQGSPAAVAKALPAASTIRKKVLVSGCFDLLHSGHVEFFRECAEYGDLYVRLGTDANIAALKGHKTMYRSFFKPVILKVCPFTLTQALDTLQ